MPLAKYLGKLSIGLLATCLLIFAVVGLVNAINDGSISFYGEPYAFDYSPVNGFPNLMGPGSWIMSYPPFAEAI